MEKFTVNYALTEYQTKCKFDIRDYIENDLYAQLGKTIKESNVLMIKENNDDPMITKLRLEGVVMTLDEYTEIMRENKRLKDLVEIFKGDVK